MTKIRLGAVFYGGISLAVYMSGIANELLNLVRSTQDGVTLSPVQQVYKDLAAQIETNYESPVQFSIDAISGTSAGGINGVFLAYALNNGGSLDALTDIWAKEGDFNAILNTEFSRINAPFARPSGLLNGNRFYVKIFESLCQLDKDSKELDKDGKFTQTPPKPKYPGQPVRLVVTATDLDGGEIPLTTKQNDLNENNHAYSFKFDLNSLIQAKLPMLAFAARVTAGIPGVFESLNLDSALELIKSNANKSDQRYQQFSTSMAKDFCDFFVGLKPPQDIGQRRFVDGGVLDNKPLAHAISALKSEPSTGETHLMYIEPTNSSLHVIDNPKEKSEKPKEPASRPISDATRSVGIRMDEPIRPDLEVAQHLNRVADVIYPEFDQDFLNGLKASSPVNQASQAFHAYSQLRLRQVSRRLASIALTVQGLPVVEALIEEKASLFATHLDVKKEIDTWFVLRKLQFLLRLFKAQKINPLTLKEVQDAYQTQHSAMKNVSSKNILATAHEAEDTNKIPSEALPLDQATVKVWLGRLEFFLVAKVRGVANDLQHFKTHLNDPDIASHWEDCFTNLDMQYFPMLAAIDLDDVLKLEVFRVGTEAATIGQSYLKGIESKKKDSTTRLPKLAGTTIGNFSGFLREDWRLNDILWGRLDASEMLIEHLGESYKVGTSQLKEFISQVHNAVWKEFWEKLSESQKIAFQRLYPDARTDKPVIDVLGSRTEPFIFSLQEHLHHVAGAVTLLPEYVFGKDKARSWGRDFFFITLCGLVGLLFLIFGLLNQGPKLVFSALIFGLFWVVPILFSLLLLVFIYAGLRYWVGRYFS